MREFKKGDREFLENKIESAFSTVGIDISKNKAKTVLRIILSEIASYFFKHPDDLVDVGFIRLRKNPKKEELFAVEILYNDDEGIVNAPTLRDFYTGTSQRNKQLKFLLDTFVEELLQYSTEQELNAHKTIDAISRGLLSEEENKKSNSKN